MAPIRRAPDRPSRGPPWDSTRSSRSLTRTALQTVEAAGPERWPDLFQTLRRGAETDFASRFPPHVAAAWMGHSPAVSARHYLQVPEAMLDAAAGFEPGRALHPALQHCATGGCRVVQAGRGAGVARPAGVA